MSPDEEPARPALAQMRDDSASRKRFLKMLGGGGAAGAFAVLLAACGDDEEKSTATSSGADTQAQKQASTQATSPKKGSSGDIEIVNYALTLEYLEADFYKQVIASGLVKDKKLAALAQSIGQNEQEHVEALKTTVEQLGGTPVTAPKTKFEPVLEQGLKTVLETAATVENLGAAAYLGQAGRIESPEILAAALSIHSVEARHAAALNFLVGRGFKGSGKLEGAIPDGAFAEPMTMEEVLAQVKPFIAS